MKGFLFTSFLVVPAALMSSVSAEPHHCNKNYPSGAIREYSIRSTDAVPDIPGICGGLWDNMHRSGECGTLSSTWCGDVGDGILGWDFTSFVGCSDGMIASTWWEATRNQWGSIDCVDEDDDI